jgi:hypothetical protein
MKRSNLLGIRLVAFALLAAGLAMSQANSPHSTSKESSEPANAWMAVPTPYTAHDEGIAESVRAERDRFFDKDSEEAPLTPERAAGTRVAGAVWFGPQPEIPEVPNRAIVIATFTEHRSILSASRRSVYTEITLNVEQVFEDQTGSGRPFPH